MALVPTALALTDILTAPVVGTISERRLDALKDALYVLLAAQDLSRTVRFIVSDTSAPAFMGVAADHARVNVSSWVRKLLKSKAGEKEFIADPGCISVRFTPLGERKGRAQVVWYQSQAVDLKGEKRGSISHGRLMASTTSDITRSLLADDDDSDIVSSARYGGVPWTTPLEAEITTFAPITRSSSASSTESDISFSSKNSSVSSLSAAAPEFCYDPFRTPRAPTSQKAGGDQCVIFDEEEPSEVFVDTSKSTVTPYDGGKTTVLTGGVMLGKKKPATKGRF